MGIFKRIWNWICSLFGAQKSEKADVDQYIREMQEMLRNMKAQTEAVIVAQDKKNRELAQCREQIIKMVRYAEKALHQNDEAGARFFLEKKAVLDRRLADLEQQVAAAADYTAQAEVLQQKAEAQLAEIMARRDGVKAKLAAAELAGSMSELESSTWNQTLQAKAEEAQLALDKAEALAELEERAADGDLAALMRKYDQTEETGSTADPAVQTL